MYALDSRPTYHGHDITNPNTYIDLALFLTLLTHLTKVENEQLFANYGALYR